MILLYHLNNIGASECSVTLQSCMSWTPPKIYLVQATLHFPVAFWGMLLPVTVHGRVSDIWRSYFTQVLLPAAGAVASFAPAWVEQVCPFTVLGSREMKALQITFEQLSKVRSNWE